MITLCLKTKSLWNLSKHSEIYCHGWRAFPILPLTRTFSFTESPDFDSQNHLLSARRLSHKAAACSALFGGRSEIAETPCPFALTQQPSTGKFGWARCPWGLHWLPEYSRRIKFQERMVMTCLVMFSLLTSCPSLSLPTKGAFWDHLPNKLLAHKSLCHVLLLQELKTRKDRK